MARRLWEQWGFSARRGAKAEHLLKRNWLAGTAPAGDITVLDQCSLKRRNAHIEHSLSEMSCWYSHCPFDLGSANAGQIFRSVYQTSDIKQAAITENAMKYPRNYSLRKLLTWNLSDFPETMRLRFDVMQFRLSDGKNQFDINKLTDLTSRNQ